MTVPIFLNIYLSIKIKMTGSLIPDDHVSPVEKVMSLPFINQSPKDIMDYNEYISCLECLIESNLQEEQRQAVSFTVFFNYLVSSYIEDNKAYLREMHRNVFTQIGRNEARDAEMQLLLSENYVGYTHFWVTQFSTLVAGSKNMTTLLMGSERHVKQAVSDVNVVSIINQWSIDGTSIKDVPVKTPEFQTSIMIRRFLAGILLASRGLQVARSAEEAKSLQSTEHGSAIASCLVMIISALDDQQLQTVLSACDNYLILLILQCSESVGVCYIFTILCFAHIL